MEIIDALFEDQLDIIENGVARRVSVFEAILLQLWIKEMSGNKRAIAVRLRYQEFVAGQGDAAGFLVECVENDYTRRLVEGLQGQGTKSE